jgi:hypothetical protein
MKSAREYLDEDLEAVVGNGPMGGPPSYADYPSTQHQPMMAPPGMMPGYYPVSNYPISPAMMGGMGTLPESVPIYKKPLVTFFTGAALVGAAWIYFDLVRPRMAKAKAKAAK